MMEPRLAGNNQVNAEVRLKFLHDERQMLVKRKVNLTKQAKGFKVAALEQSIATRINGEAISVSQNCAEIDKQVPELLQIAPMMLHKVMLCQHEEAFWMFGDSSQLEATFDELFETKGMTRAHDLLWEGVIEAKAELRVM